MHNKANRIIGLSLLVITSGGYHGYYVQKNELGYLWLFVCLLGITFLIIHYLNNFYQSSYQGVFRDILCILFVFVFPLWRLPGGASIFIALVVSGIYIIRLRLDT